jgi:hypothetical protein
MFLRGLVWIPIWLIIIPLLSMFVFPAIGTFYPFFKMLFSSGYKLKEYDPFKNDKKSDNKTCLDFIKDNLIYKRTLVLVFAILNLFTCANTYLGAKYFGGVVLATILAVIFGNIFVNTEPDDATMISVKNTVEEPVLEKPAAVDDDDCGPFQHQVIEAWQKLKAQNDEADRLIQQFGNSVIPEIQNEIFKLKKQRANIIEQFKKLDGKTDLENVFVLNTMGEPVKYTVLAVAYKSFVTICAKNIENAQKEKEEQAAKEEAAKEEAAKEAQRKEQAARAQTANTGNNNNNNNSATGGGSSSSNSPVVSTDNNNNSSATGGSSSSNSPVVSTDNNNNNSATGGGSSSSNSPDVSTDNNISATGGGSSSSNSPVVSSSQPENLTSAGGNINSNSSSDTGMKESTAVVTSNPTLPAQNIDLQKLPAGVDVASSQQGIAVAGGNKLSQQRVNRSKIPSKPLEDLLTELISEYIAAPFDPNETDTPAEKLMEQIKATMATLYNMDNIKFSKYSPENIEEEAFTILKQNKDLQKQVKSNIINSSNSNSNSNSNSSNSNSNSNSNNSSNIKPGKTFTETLKGLFRNTSKPGKKEIDNVISKVSTAVEANEPTEIEIDVNLSLLPEDILTEQLKTATDKFVNEKTDLQGNLFGNMKLLLEEKYRREGNSTQLDDKLDQIIDQQKKQVQNGGSKGKNKTLKNRKQRFNIRLV